MYHTDDLHAVSYLKKTGKPGWPVSPGGLGFMQDSPGGSFQRFPPT
jgi:hypothetical protein